MEAGGWVILSLSSGERRLVQLKPGAKLSFSRHSFHLDPLVGAPFGANFRVDAGGLVRDSRTVEEISGAVGDAFAGVVCAGPHNSNAEIYDTSTAQQLDDKAIAELRSKGAQGEEIIKALAQNSATFASKTAFAQDKYLRKKAKKYMPSVHAIKPSALTVCDLYMVKGPEKLLMLRRDSLALLLSLSNVQPGSRALVVESVLGLLTASIAQRQGGEGLVVAAHLHKPVLDALQWLNLTSDEVCSVRSCHLKALLAGACALGDRTARGVAAMGGGEVEDSARGDVAGEETVEGGGAEEAVGTGGAEEATGAGVAEATMGARVAEEAEEAMEGGVADVEMGEGVAEEVIGGGAAEEVTAAEEATGEGVAEEAIGERAVGEESAVVPTPKDRSSRKRRAEEGAGGEEGTSLAPEEGVNGDGEKVDGKGSKARVVSLQEAELSATIEEGFTSLVLATRDSPTAVLPLLLKLLRPGGVFVVYHQSMQPLAECLHACHRSREAVRLQLIEPWSRTYQVAPNRTHPMMNAHPPTGFVLSGIKVVNDVGA